MYMRSLAWPVTRFASHVSLSEDICLAVVACGMTRQTHFTIGRVANEVECLGHLGVPPPLDRVGVEPSYLSKVERGEQPPPSEAKIVALAGVLDVDADVLLAMAGKVSSDLQEAIRKRPQLFAELIRQLRTAPDRAVLRLE